MLDLPHKKIVLHSARQDLEIFYHHYQFTPKNLADTQIMAAVLGYGDQIGFDSLVNVITNDIIDKSQQRTNWLKRPLNEAQITYAASDVIFLAKIYPILENALIEKNRQEWIVDELKELCNPEIFTLTPKAITRKIRHKLLHKQAIAILNALALWREETAIEKDVIRTLVCADSVIIHLAEKRPTTIEAVQKIKNIKQSIIQHYHQDIIDLIIKTKEAPYSDSDNDIKPERLTFSQEKLINILSLAADAVAQNHSVARRLYATQNDIIHYVRHKEAGFLSGWRYDLFGHIVHDLTHGKKGIFYHNGQLQFQEV